MGKTIDRYYADAERTARKIPTYPVIDRITGKHVTEYDCLLWSEHKAEELNNALRSQSETQGAEKPEEKRVSVSISECTPEA